MTRPDVTATIDSSAEDDDTHVFDWIDMLLQHGVMTGLIFAITLAIGVAYAFLATPIYRADTLIQVEDKKPAALAGVEHLADALGTAASPVTGEVEILRSRGVILKALEKTGGLIQVRAAASLPLIGDWLERRRALSGASAGSPAALQISELRLPEGYLDSVLVLRSLGAGRYELQDKDGAKLGQAEVGEALAFSLDSGEGGIVVSALRAEAGATFEIVRQAPLTAYREVLRNLIVAESGRDSNIIRVSYENPDEGYACELVNAISTVYIEQDVARRSAQADQSLKFLSGQLPDIERNVERTENALNDFRTRTGTIDIDKSAGALLQRAVDVEKSRLELQLQRDELLQRYTPAHPAIKALDNQLAQARRESDRVSELTSKVPADQRDLLRLQRDVSVGTQLYTALLDTVQQLKLARAGTVGNARIIDMAVRDALPVAPRKSLVVLMAILLGGALSIAAATVARQLRPTLRDVEEVERLTGLSTYANIPESRDQQRISQARNSSGKPSQGLLALQYPDDPAVESLRALRIGLAFALLGARGKSLVVTGPTAGVGKTFISANLAVLLAGSGKRVLLIETDLRRPQLGGYFGLPRGHVGLSSVLAGEASLAEAIHVQPVESGELHVVASGPLPPNPGELLLSEAFQRLLNDVQDRYDHVLLDSAPVLPVSDTLAVTRHAGSTFLVLRAEQTTLGEVRAAVKKISGAGGSVNGLLLNGVMRRRVRFSTSYSYYYQYGRRR
ncbi:capsular polysaccharide biosynthesis protein [Bordetella ansorpii]|uniref:Putative tyrosine-protein kinase EpsB n=1 Tax=Bordetella ansorpii TaxID=288768 RepID=A0A146AWV8_9BORD|nr:polysaccharide biosynthesis tyrosine autokinase [Bordetella ansorpii]CZZ94075.1 capsular polysaccharide biosynthesis protein [Bordetella ansorpii]